MKYMDTLPPIERTGYAITRPEVVAYVHDRTTTAILLVVIIPEIFEEASLDDVHGAAQVALGARICKMLFSEDGFSLYFMVTGQNRHVRETLIQKTFERLVEKLDAVYSLPSAFRGVWLDE